jgi:dipeptidyl aminopeptidase/acylaminoacyl peptidase
MPVVIYLHGNSSSRLEGLKIAPELLKRDINLFVLDFAGCGLSEGEFISLGWHEKDQVGIVVDFLEKLPGVGKIGLWGRSMGAATSLMYNHIDDRIFACCYDSPFSEFTKLAKELCRKQIKLPHFVLDTALSFIRKTIQKKNDMDIYKLQPISYASKTNTPGFFVHAMNDELIPLEHSINLFEVYAGEKSLNVCEGTHNSTRQKHIIEKIGKFFSKYLKNIEEDVIYTNKISSGSESTRNYNSENISESSRSKFK